jgi:hypothetical protein
MMSNADFLHAVGNKASLSLTDRELLETKILPTARRWCEAIPSLRHHGIKTLAYWGEAIPPAHHPGRNETVGTAAPDTQANSTTAEQDTACDAYTDE